MTWETRAVIGYQRKPCYIDSGGIVKLQTGSDNEKTIKNNEW